ncbi:cation diffusion facilitator family transporter [Prevotella corporis]|uniref:Cation diffusion facilitator family transporter n=1 Tax=Prevotella corporis TaxID=28128 RepID=A0A133Q6D9_9BACT|nr:cation diffusion facilitator family transporter [Prevotella corporis]KXA38448.1 cation diffusion facilitator family transporter [Prevotella corporis]
MKERNKSSNGGMLSVIAALGANILVAISKFIGYAISGSVAMLNESIHSVVDCANQILLLIGDRQSKKGKSAIHPFGQARAKYFYSIIVAMMLFFCGGVLGIMEASEKILLAEHYVEKSWIVLAILLIGIIIESFSLHIALKEIKVLNKEKLPLYKFLKESRHSEILIIFAEDSCALIGLLLAIIGTILSFLTNNALYDALSGLLIGILLCSAALLLVREFYSLLVGESVSNKDLALIKLSFSRPEVTKLIDIRTIHLSPVDIFLAAKIDVNAGDQEKISQLINDIERNIRGDFPDYTVYIYIETDKFQNDYHRDI